MIAEITHLIHILFLRGSHVSFCWVPSHCGLHNNELVDILAKEGSKLSLNTKRLEVKFSVFECYSILGHTMRKQAQSDNNKYFKDKQNFNVDSLKHFIETKCNNLMQIKQIVSLMFRWNTNGFITKFSKNISCICGDKITKDHILNCQQLKQSIPILGQYPFTDIKNCTSFSSEFLKSLLSSPIGSFLYFFFNVY